MKETPVLFGPRGDLVGLVTLPAAAGGTQTTLGCLLFNAGVVHRVGLHRVNVKLARALAAREVTSIRFDLSGLGDSPAARDGAGGADQAVGDLKSAMDHLHASAGIERFVVVGVCSGAVNGYRLALSDMRVVGLMMFDGFVFPTPKTHFLRRWLRFRATPWPRLLAEIPLRIRHVFSRPPAPPPGLFDADAVPVTPPRAEFSRAMDSLAAGGVSSYIMYSGSFLEGHNYDGQLRDAFRGAAFLDKLHYAYLPEVDHTLTSLAAQRKFIDAVCAWVVGLK